MFNSQILINSLPDLFRLVALGPGGMFFPSWRANFCPSHFYPLLHTMAAVAEVCQWILATEVRHKVAPVSAFVLDVLEDCADLFLSQISSFRNRANILAGFSVTTGCCIDLFRIVATPNIDCRIGVWKQIKNSRQVGRLHRGKRKVNWVVDGLCLIRGSWNTGFFNVLENRYIYLQSE